MLIEALSSYQAEQLLAIQECLRRSGAGVLRLQVASDLQRQETTLTLHMRPSSHHELLPILDELHTPAGLKTLSYSIEPAPVPE
jgi:hypothetical protein